MKKKNWFSAIWLFALCCGWLSISSNQVAFAAESQVFSNNAVTARLISAEDGVSPDASSVSVGLVLEHGDGWKGYWRTPGEVGLAPSIDWAGSSNLATAEILWPAPKRFDAFGIENFGYSGDLILPIRVTLVDQGRPLKLSAAVNLLTCSDICVPHAFELSLDLPEGTSIDRNSAEAIARFASKVPSSPRESDIEIKAVAFDPDSYSLFVTAQSTKPFQSADVFPEFGSLVTFGKPDIRLSRDKSQLWARVPIKAWSEEYQKPLVTLTDESRAITAPVVLSSEIPAPPYENGVAKSSLAQLVAIAIVAFIGGLILNFMPCVLPVLSIKFASAMKSSGQSHRVIRNGFLFSALGVLTFVWTLAIVVLTLKWFGVSVGWGIQFQNPVFVSLMFVVIALFSANLLGMFEITLPYRLQDRLTAGGDRSGYAADFGTGFLAAILATPCSAPFLGTAITFALAGTSVDVLIVFTALGMGLAAPYLSIAWRPSLVGRLPRPGRWMLFLQAALGALLLATAAWLLFVLLGVAGWRAVTFVSASTIVLIFLLFLDWSPTFIRRSLIVATLALPLIGVGHFSAQSTSYGATQDTYWQPFAPQEIAQHVATGHTVFVDVTADWCLTCKANKALVLDRAAVADRLGDTTVIAMQADWTRPDDEISRFLERHNRFGIPFNVVFGPSKPSGIALPELLTEKAVLGALDAASTKHIASDRN